MSAWSELEVPILEGPVHTCMDGVTRYLVYQRTVVVREHEGHIKDDLFLMKQFNLKLYWCDTCQRYAGVRA